MQTRYLIILLEGAADLPIEGLEGRTPLQCAPMVHTNQLATAGRVGLVRLIPEQLDPLNEIAVSRVLGYDLGKSWCGSGALELAGQRVRLENGERVFCCDFVTLDDETLLESRVEGLDRNQASILIDSLQTVLSEFGARLLVDAAGRMLVILNDSDRITPHCTPPRLAKGRRLKSVSPSGTGSDRIKKLMAAAASVLQQHEVNDVRADLGENPANSIWLWGGGKTPRWTRFRQQFNLGAAMVTDSSALLGLASLLAIRGVAVDQAIGDLGERCKAATGLAIAAFEDSDIVAVQLAMPEWSHDRDNAAAKIEALQILDERLVGPLAAAVARFEQSRMMIAATLVDDSERNLPLPEAVPFCIAGSGVAATSASALTESAARSSDLHIERGHELMEYFLRV